MRRLATVLLLTLLGCSSPPPEPPRVKDTAPVTFSVTDLALGAVSSLRALDLTYPFGPETLCWPTERPFERTDEARGRTPGGWFYAAGKFSAPEHGGTHVDAPLHFSERGLAVDEVPLTRLSGRAWILDARRACAKDPDHLVTVADFEAQERASPLPERAFVLILTGWGRYWPSRRAYLGDDAPGRVDALHFPGIDASLAKLLVARRCRVVGIDTASIDRGASRAFEAHQVLAAGNVAVIENVANLDALVPGAWVIAAPMKIEGGTGAPVRLVALAPEARPVSIEAKDRAREVADALARLAPAEVDVRVAGDSVECAVSPTFARDDRRAASLEAALARAAFRVRFALDEGEAAWKAPEWPVRGHHHHAPGGERKHHDFERGTNAERIARYEDPARDAWQKPDQVVQALPLADGAVLADLGVGSGYFALRFARAYPKAQVVGLDIEPGFVEHVTKRAGDEGLANVTARVVKPDDPVLAPASVDVVLIVDTYHHLPDRAGYLAKLRAALRPGGRVVVIDFKKESKLGPAADHKLAREVVLDEAARAGLTLGKEHDFLPEQYVLELVPR